MALQRVAGQTNRIRGCAFVAIAATAVAVGACDRDRRSHNPDDSVHQPRLGHTAQYGGEGAQADGTTAALRPFEIRLTWPKNAPAAYAQEVEYLRVLVGRWWATRAEHLEADGTEFGPVFDTMRERAKEATSPGHYAAVLRDGLCNLGDGHLRLSQADAPTQVFRSGVTFGVASDGVVVRSVDGKAFSGRTRPRVGDRLERIDGQPANAYFQKTCLQPGSTPAHRLEAGLAALSTQRLFKHEKPGPTKITLRRDAGTYEVELPWRFAKGSSPGPCVKGKILNRRRKVGLLTVGTFWCMDPKGQVSDATFEAQLKKALGKAGRARDLIVDVRENGGGRDQQAQALATALVARRLHWMRFAHPTPMNEKAEFHDSFVEPGRAKSRPKRVWLLAGPGCFSTCEIFVAALAGRDNVTIIGRKTAGGVGNPKPFRLPYSGHVVTIPVSRFTIPSDAEVLIETHGVPPDVEILPTAQDVREKRDPVIEGALARIRDGG